MSPASPPKNKLEEQATAKADLSYSYWASSQRSESSQFSVPRKLTEEEIRAQEEAKKNCTTGASVWNHAGTFEEKAVTEWAKERLISMLKGIQHAKLKVAEATIASGDAHIWIVRGKKRCGFDFDLSVEWRKSIGNGATEVRGYIKIPNAASDDLDDLHVNVEIMHSRSEYKAEEDLAIQEAKTLIPSIQSTLANFYEELKQK